MNHSTENTDKKTFHHEWEQLTRHERDIIESVLSRVHVPRNANTEFKSRSSFGERASDAIAAFGGSWTFILIFMACLFFWAVINTEILGPLHAAFDPYPYVFLNLILSMLAAIQAPIIMMSQNRQSAKDRLDAEIDHGVNVRSELAIRELSERLRRIEQMIAITAFADSESPTHAVAPNTDK